MNCEKHDECGREVFWEPTGLCLQHEKERRASASKKSTRRSTKKKDSDATEDRE